MEHTAATLCGASLLRFLLSKRFFLFISSFIVSGYTTKASCHLKNKTNSAHRNLRHLIKHFLHHASSKGQSLYNHGRHKICFQTVISVDKWCRLTPLAPVHDIFVLAISITFLTSLFTTIAC